MKSRSLIVLPAALFLLSPFGFGQVWPERKMASKDLPAKLRQGILVEQVAKNSEADKSQMQEGDILLSWVRADVHGELASPIDLSRIEAEQAPRGAVAIEGFRGAQRQVWILGPNSWGISARPNLPESFAAGYLEGQKLAQAGKFTEATKRWNAGAKTIKSSLIRIWLILHSAELFSDARQWKNADDHYKEALQGAAGLKPAIKVYLLYAWADSFNQRNDWTNAEKYYRQAITESRKSAAESLLVARILNQLARMNRSRGNFARAEQNDRQALAMSERLVPGSSAVARCLNGLGKTAIQRGDVAEAENYFNYALAIEKTDIDAVAADSFYGLGRVSYARSDFVNAEKYIRQALVIRKKIAPDSLDVAASLTTLGVVFLEHGDLVRAEEYYRQALGIQVKLSPGSFNFAVSLVNLGLLMWEYGDGAKAEEYFRQALAVQEKLAPGGLQSAYTLHNLGFLSWKRGDPDKAEKYYREALTIRGRLSPNSFELAPGLIGLGIIFEDRGNLVRARQYYRRALAKSQKIMPGGQYVAMSLDSLGVLAAKQGNLPKAEKYVRQAVEIEQELSEGSYYMADFLIDLGKITRDGGNFVKAEKAYREAVVITEQRMPLSLCHAEALAGLAWTMHHQKQWDSAVQLYSRALNAFETQAFHLGSTDQVRSRFREKQAGYYKDYIDLLVTRNQPEFAFEVSERWRARGLLEILSQAHVDLRRGVDPGLLKQEQSLKAEIAAKSDRRLRLFGSQRAEVQLATISKEIEDLVDQYQEIEERIWQRSPSYAGLTQPHPLTVKEVQQRLLDADTVLLEYVLGKERSYVFVVDPGSLTVHELPKRAEIEFAARRLHKLITAQGRTGTNVIQDATQLRRAVRLQQASAALSQIVLSPVVEQIKGKRLLVVSDGVLQYIPLAALPIPGEPASGKAIANGTLPLVVEHEIVNLPSASVLSALRPQGPAAPKAIAVLADPVFDAQDERIRRRGKTRKPDLRMPVSLGIERRSAPASRSVDLARSLSDVRLLSSGSFYLPRLPFSRREAQSILAMTPPGQEMAALDFEASRSTMLSPELAQYRIVHIATHGLLDSDHPFLSGLVLSLVDNRGRPQNGFLGLQDIYDLDLHADLVVLSGCETGLGKEIDGEGLVGLVRGFMYAGARRVVASLWNADDAATSELMVKFYTAMERDRMRPAAALRQAQIAMWKQSRWSDAYYWAGFEIQGDWK